jgi:HTH-type transcriptional regulator, transcriptional repressor of NAD biosynthesis genes
VSTAFVLMTAMPPTKGHLHLVQFASHVADETCVIVGTQPGEPYVRERVEALAAAARAMNGVRVTNIHEMLPQTPDGNPGFWEMWRAFLVTAGCRGAGDFIVASEPYGAMLAEVTGSTFIPFDIARELTDIRATRIRQDPLGRFAEILPEFQAHLRQRVTIFGAESTGKTTLSRELASAVDGHWLPEWARPYLEGLETVGIDDERMHAIWRGQRALQKQGQDLLDRPFIIQDTDLFATVGFWDYWHPGETPAGLVADAHADKSSLYLLTRSNIPFEADPQRYGIDARETSDDYWIDLAQRHALNYRILDAADPAGRLEEASALIRGRFAETVSAVLGYERRDNG